MKYTEDSFGKTSDGREASLYILENENGMSVKITNYGGIITSLMVPDRSGKMEDVILGYEKLSDYEEHAGPYMGALIGRYANRIAGGQFKMDLQEYNVAVNNTPNHLHGGIQGFDKQLWSAIPYQTDEVVGVQLSYVSEHGEEGFPGRLSVEVSYEITADNELHFNYKAQTDRSTVVNLTNHCYFNLKGRGDILNHKLQVNADSYLPVNDEQIPLEITKVEGTPFDLRSAQVLEKCIHDSHEQIKKANGFDHCWVLNGDENEMKEAASLYDPESGREMTVITSEPGIQIYSGNFLGEELPAKSGEKYTAHSGIALETQHFPDSPNRFDFPTTILRPDQEFTSKTKLVFKNR